MAWRDEYDQKLMSFTDAARLIRAGDVVYTPIGGDARSFMPAVFARIAELEFRVRVRACAPQAQDWFLPEYWDLPIEFSVEIFGGNLSRAALAARRADFYPQLFSNQFNLYDSRPDDQEPIDVFIAHCTPPDDEGYVTFGGMPWHKGDFTRRADRTILEVSPWLPNVRTTERVHVSEVAAFVMTELTERPAVAVTVPPPETITIAGYVNEIVQDGDTCQIGAGRTATHLVPSGAFAGKRDIGWHSEITPLGVVPLMMSGVINNSRKSVDTGVGVTTTVSPRSDEEHEWLETSGLLDTRPVREVNSIVNVAAQERMCSINNAFAVDLTDQICDESLGTVVYNGTGGQPENHIGAFLSKGGKAITLLSSTALDGVVSRIVPQLEAGSLVTIPRFYADFIVTEFGIARLLGKNHRERAEALIAVAHPNFREELKHAARKLFG